MTIHDDSLRIPERAAAPSTLTRKMQPRPYKPKDWEVELDELRATLAARDAALQQSQGDLQHVLDTCVPVEELRAAEAALRACQKKS